MKKHVKKHHQQKKFPHCLSSHGCLREEKRIMNEFSVSARLKTKETLRSVQYGDGGENVA